MESFVVISIIWIILGTMIVTNAARECRNISML